MHVDCARHDHEAARRHFFLGQGGLSRGQNSGDLVTTDCDIARGSPNSGKNGVAAADDQIEGRH